LSGVTFKQLLLLIRKTSDLPGLNVRGQIRRIVEQVSSVPAVSRSRSTVDMLVNMLLAWISGVAHD
jgi:hypothetical protein